MLGKSNPCGVFLQHVAINRSCASLCPEQYPRCSNLRVDHEGKYWDDLSIIKSPLSQSPEKIRPDSDGSSTICTLLGKAWLRPQRLPTASAGCIDFCNTLATQCGICKGRSKKPGKQFSINLAKYLPSFFGPAAIPSSVISCGSWKDMLQVICSKLQDECAELPTKTQAQKKMSSDRKITSGHGKKLRVTSNKL